MLNRIAPFKKAAGRITVYCLFVLSAFFIQFDHADAASVLKKTSTLISEPTVANNRVTFTLSGSVKYIQHAKYLSPAYDTPDDIGITQAKTRITGFAYTCPGYYTTRIYSDDSGQKLIGYIQTYVPETDISNGACTKLTKPPTNTPEIPSNPPAPKSNTHPVPEYEGVKSTPTATKPNIKTAADKPAVTKPVTFQEYCEKNYSHSKFEPNKLTYEKVPYTGTDYWQGSDCCPIKKKDGTSTGLSVMYIYDAYDDEVYLSASVPGVDEPREGWGCGQLANGASVSKFYCPDGLAYVSSSNTCNEEIVVGDLGSWPADPLAYDPDWSDISTFGVPMEKDGEMTEDEARPDGTVREDGCVWAIHFQDWLCDEKTEGPEKPGETPQETCEENPNQDHCPPPCYCEKLGEWGYLCCVFDCPGWGAYLSFLSDDLVGTATAPPVPDLPAPDIPNIFDILNNVDQRNPAKPTGQEDPGLGASSFDENDIKNEAPEIEFREDPTGGFNIVNPLETLPDDGSTAPRPEEELETLPYPGGSGKNLEGNGSVPKPSGSSGKKDKINYPGEPGGQAKPPTTGGQARPPTTGEKIDYPGT